ncbi:hypothetical protein [Kineococcus auxinigenes]
MGEVWVVTPRTCSVQVLTGPDTAVEGSDVLGVTTGSIAVALGWR